MSGKADLLERAVELFPPPEGSFDRLLRRRDRRRRNRRITTIVFALALAFAAIGSAIEAFRDVHRRVPAGPVKVAWIRQFGSPGDDLGADVAVQGDLVYVSGSTSRGTSGLPMGHELAFLDGFDRAAGDHTWHAGAGRGGYAVASDASGVYQGGYEHGQTFLAKFDPGGTELWSQDLGFGGYVESIATYGGSVYVAGRAFDGLPGHAGIGHQDGFIGKYDAAGRPVWVRLLGTPRWDEARAVAIDDTGIYVTGVARGTTYPPAEDMLWKLSEQGELIWTRSAVHAVEAVAASHGTIYVGGRRGEQAAIGAYDRSGARLWSETFGTSNGDEIVDLVADARGVYAAGSMNERFGPRANERPGWRTISSEGFVRAYDPMGSVRWELLLRADGPVFVRGVAGGGGSLYAVGWTEGTFEGQSTRGGVDAFVARMDLG